MIDTRREAAFAAERVTDVLDDVFGWLAKLADRLRTLHHDAETAGRALHSGELAALREDIFARLRSHSALFAGTGVILADDVLADRSHWLEWWQNRGGPTPVFLEVDHDPSSVDFYDYDSAAWFAHPRSTGERIVVGPYVDYSGTDEYMLTFAHPVHCKGRFLGVAATDIRADAFESVLLGALGPSGPPVALVNSTGRVVASNTPHAIAGSLVPESGHRGGETDSTVDDIPVACSASAGCAGLPWRVSVLRC